MGAMDAVNVATNRIWLLLVLRFSFEKGLFFRWDNVDLSYLRGLLLAAYSARLEEVRSYETRHA